MCVLFITQDFLDVVNNGYTPIAENATKAQRNEKCDTRKKDQKEYLYICQCMDTSVFKKICDATKAKAMCDTLVQCYGGETLVKKVKLQSMHNRYENLIMKDNEKVREYISRVIVVTKLMKACGEMLSEQVIIEKVLRSLTP